MRSLEEHEREESCVSGPNPSSQDNSLGRPRYECTRQQWKDIGRSESNDSTQEKLKKVYHILFPDMGEQNLPPFRMVSWLHLPLNWLIRS
jgi:hypothetical protein